MEEDLALLECPFTWNVPDISSRRDEFLEKVNSRDLSIFLMDGFVLKIIDCFERVKADDIKTATINAKKFDEELNRHKSLFLNKTVDKQLWDNSSEAVRHVILSTQAHLAFIANESDALNKLMAEIKPVDLFDDGNKAAVFAIKCRFFMEYGPFDTTKLAINYIREAIRLDDSIPLYHFYLGKCLAHYRRANAYHDPPSEEELNELEKAYSGNKTPEEGVMLLESYAEILKNMNVCNRKQIERKCSKLLSFIQSCTGDEWKIYWRCAHLSMRLPRHLVHKQEIKSLIDMAVDSCSRNGNNNNSFVHSIQSTYYKCFERDLIKALEHAEKAANYGALPSALEVIAIKYKINNEEDLIPVIDKFINQENIFSNSNQLFYIKANYLFFVKNQIHDAFKLYFESMRKNCKDYCIMHCRPFFEEVKEKSYNLYEVLERELNSLISHHKNDQVVILYKGYLDRLKEYKKKSTE